MSKVAEGGRRNYQTIRLGFRNLFCRLRIIIDPVPHGQFLPAGLKAHMPFKKVHMPFKRIPASPATLHTAMNDTPKKRQEIARPKSGRRAL